MVYSHEIRCFHSRPIYFFDDTDLLVVGHYSPLARQPNPFRDVSPMDLTSYPQWLCITGEEKESEQSSVSYEYAIAFRPLLHYSEALCARILSPFVSSKCYAEHDSTDAYAAQWAVMGVQWDEVRGLRYRYNLTLSMCLSLPVDFIKKKYNNHHH